MAECQYRHCRIEFEPKKKGTRFEQKFHTQTCRSREWMLNHPRITKKHTGNGSFHHAKLEKSTVLQKTLELLKRTEPTTIQIAEYTGSTRASSDVSELRHNGFNILATYVGLSDNGRKVHRYKLI
jgi:hypothetical protein